MGLVLIVGAPAEVLGAPADRHVAAALERYLAGAVEIPLAGCVWSSDELPWSGWSELQSQAAAALGHPPPHLTAVEAWFGVFVPVRCQPAELAIPSSATPLQVASAIALQEELFSFATARNIPTEDAKLRALAEQHIEDDDEGHTEIQVLAELLPGVSAAIASGQPLWVVK